MIQGILAPLMLLVMPGAIAGCNAIEGVGKAIERGGDATRQTVKDVKKNM